MTKLLDVIEEPSSYKDRSGRLVYRGDKVVRLIDDSFKTECIEIIESGFYEQCIEKEYLWPFESKEENGQLSFYSDKIELIIYPYEWGFEQFKAAALFHLDFLQYCLDNNYTLKDATPFNVQFVNGKPVFIDHLSIVKYSSGSPWMGYKQYCEMFVAPLVLSANVKGRWVKQLMMNLEGYSLEEVADILPFRCRFKSLAFIHIISLSKFKSSDQGRKFQIPKKKIKFIIKHLFVELEVLKPIGQKQNWLNYKSDFPYSASELNHKNELLSSWLTKEDSGLLLDVGANHSDFVNDVRKFFREVVLLDSDQAVVDDLFLNQVSNGSKIVEMDITMMSPSLGLNLTERSSFLQRIKPDVVLGLALVHHLFHQRNIPLAKIAELFNLFTGKLIVEFVDYTDEKYQVIENPENQHPYNKALFEKSFSKYYKIKEQSEVKKGKRYMYLMEKKNA